MDWQPLMRRAIGLARKGRSETHPNPLVGALIVEGGEVVAEGWHAKAGEAHAEVMALEALGRAPREDATLVVTLEPCSTTRRTGPCTEAIVRAGIRRVVVGAGDPNPAHAGRGLTLLREAGVAVLDGVLAEDCADLNLIFNHWITHQTPLIAAKAATSLDGRTASRSGHSRWITGEAARADVMCWRRYFPAIAAGAGTAVADNPSLTARIEGEPDWCPRRFIFDARLRSLRLEPGLNVFTDAWRERTTLVCTPEAATTNRASLDESGMEFWAVPDIGSAAGMATFRRRCAEAGLTGVFIEGGSNLHSVMLRARQLDYLLMYRAPVILADEHALPAFQGLQTDRVDHGIRLEHIRHETFGGDSLTRGFLAYPPETEADPPYAL